MKRLFINLIRTCLIAILIVGCHAVLHMASDMGKRHAATINEHEVVSTAPVETQKRMEGVIRTKWQHTVECEHGETMECVVTQGDKGFISCSEGHSFAVDSDSLTVLTPGVYHFGWSQVTQNQDSEVVR